ncbi:TonB-dependent receptor [Paraglaciecola aestuariivivens]
MLKNIILVSLLLAPSYPIFAQNTELETIEVTAQYRTENVQKVPISMSILNSDLLTKLDIKDATDLAHMVPGMTYAEFAPGQALLSLRGIVSADDGAGMDNSIVVFLDGIYMGRLANINFDLFEIERIEVLRGPQGTLSGRNAIAGSINIITRQPESELTAKVALTKGNYDISRVNTTVSGALTEQLAGKLSVSHRSHQGYTENVLLNQHNQDENTNFIRAQLSAETEFGNWNVSVDRSSDDRKDMGRTPIENGNFDYISVWQALGGKPYKSTAPISGFSKRRLQGLGIHGVNTFSDGELTTILGWRDSTTDWEMASVGAPLGGNYDLANGVFGADVNDDITEDIQQKSVEFRWNQDLSDELQYTLGAFYLQETTTRIEQYKLDFNSQNTGQITVGNEISEQYNQTKSLALYGQTQWQFASNWLLTLGARLTKDNKAARFVTLNCGHGELSWVVTDPRCESGSGSLGILQQSFDTDVEQDWQDFSPKLAVQYTPEKNWMLYASLAKGFKSGGFPGSPGIIEVAQQAISPEKALNYELGFKSDLADNKVRLNGSVFYTDYQDLQVGWFGPTAVNPSFGSFVTTNIDDSDIKGLELEFQWLAHEYINFSGNYAYLDTQVNNFLLTTFAGEIDLSGSKLRQAPKHKSYLAADVYYPLGQKNGVIEFNLNYQFTDQQISDYINQNVILEAHELVNARLAWVSNDGAIELALWAKNLLQEEYISHAYVIGPGIIGTWGAPRTIGVTLSYQFD